MGTERLLKGAVAWAEQWEMLPVSGTVLCAVSGGRDSMVLLHFLWELGKRRGFSVAAAHYNHHLRPTAQRDEDFVRGWTAERGIPLYAGGGDVAAYCERERLSTEEGARRLRYAFLEQQRQAAGAVVIATGHHLADQAETVLWNLTRGTGMEGLRGIAPVRGCLIRPLLSTAPEELAAYAAENHIPYMEDETNADKTYSRNRLRLEVLPVLQSLNGAALENIHRTARLIAEEDGWLTNEAKSALEELGRPVPYGDFQKLPLPLRRRVVRLLLEELPAGRRDVTAAHIAAVAELGRGGYLSLPGGIYAAVEGDTLTVGLRETPEKTVPLGRDVTTWGDWEASLAPQLGFSPLRLPTTGEALSVGPWRRESRIQVGNGWRSMKRYFADHHIPVSSREIYPVLYAGQLPVAVLSLTEGCSPDCTTHQSHMTVWWSKKK